MVYRAELNLLGGLSWFHEAGSYFQVMPLAIARCCVVKYSTRGGITSLRAAWLYTFVYRHIRCWASPTTTRCEHFFNSMILWQQFEQEQQILPNLERCDWANYREHTPHGSLSQFQIIVFFPQI